MDAGTSRSTYVVLSFQSGDVAALTAIVALDTLPRVDGDAPDTDPHGWVDRSSVSVATGTIDFARSRFVRNDGSVERLTAREAETLAFLVDHCDAAVARDDLLGAVWGHHELSLSRAVDAAVSRLRRKLEPDPSSPQVLFTVHGHGYRLLLQGPDTETMASFDPPVAARRLLRLGSRTVDLSAGYVEGPGGRVPLTARERVMLEHLVRTRGQIVDAYKLARVVGVIGGKSALSNAVSRLRSKVEEDPSQPRFLLAVRGEGYRLEADPPDEAPALGEDHVRALRSLTQHVGLVLGADDCVVYRREGDVFRQVAAFGPKCGEAGGVRNPMKQGLREGIVGHAAADGQPLCVADVRADPRYMPDLVPAASEVAVPIVHAGRVVGVLDSESETPAAYDENLVNAFVLLAAIAAPAFGRAVE